MKAEKAASATECLNLHKPRPHPHAAARSAWTCEWKREAGAQKRDRSENPIWRKHWPRTHRTPNSLTSLPSRRRSCTTTAATSHSSASRSPPLPSPAPLLTHRASSSISTATTISPTASSSRPRRRKRTPSRRSDPNARSAMPRSRWNLLPATRARARYPPPPMKQPSSLPRQPRAARRSILILSTRKTSGYAWPAPIGRPSLPMGSSANRQTGSRTGPSGRQARPA